MEVDLMRTIRVGLLTVSAVAGCLVALPPAAQAAPTNAPNRLEGTADCGSLGTFDFVVNTGRSEANTWSPAFLTSTDGRTGLFIPASLDLTFTFPGGSGSDSAAKATAPGPVSCDIAATPEAGVSLTGTVTGRIVWTG
jgi:hypothetical protein